MSGLFISFEGVECAGKSTQHEKLCKYLEEREIKFISTSEPGGTEIGYAIRNIFNSEKFSNMASKTELFLLAASRHQHVSELIRPYLEKGYLVITDRFADSTIAYQAYGRGLSMELIENINNLATEGLYPTLTFLLDISSEESLKRLKKRAKNTKKSLDRIEQEKIDFFHRVREGYFSLARANPDRFKILDANKNIDEIHQKIVTTIADRLEKKGIK